MAFMEGQSRTYANFLFSSFPLIRRRAILDKSFAAFLRRSLPYRRSIRPPGGRARWGVVQLVGHLTVNEDGEGSNPSAPANFSTCLFSTCLRCSHALFTVCFRGARLPPCYHPPKKTAHLRRAFPDALSYPGSI